MSKQIPRHGIPAISQRMNSDQLKHILYTGAVILFVCVIAYMIFYNRRSRAKQDSIEGNRTPASKEAGIMEAQEAMKRDRQQKKR